LYGILNVGLNAARPLFQTKTFNLATADGGENRIANPVYFWPTPVGKDANGVDVWADPTDPWKDKLYYSLTNTVSLAGFVAALDKIKGEDPRRVAIEAGLLGLGIFWQTFDGAVRADPS